MQISQKFDMQIHFGLLMFIVHYFSKNENALEFLFKFLIRRETNGKKKRPGKDLILDHCHYAPTELLWRHPVWNYHHSYMLTRLHLQHSTGISSWTRILGEYETKENSSHAWNGNICTYIYVAAKDGNRSVWELAIGQIAKWLGTYDKSVKW